ncbi:hypothetical protein [Lacticaseibacillus saniviri]
MIRDYIEFNGHRNTDFGLFLDYGSFEWQSAKHTRSSIAVPGLSGDRFYSDNKYDNVTETFPFLLETRDFSALEMQARINHWLAEPDNYSPLYFSSFPDYELQAILTSVSALKWANNHGGSISAEFSCKPFAYRIGSTELRQIDELNGVVLRNNENLKSLPLIKIYGSGHMGLTVNDDVYEIDGADGVTYIDVENHITYSPTQGIVPGLARFPNHQYPTLPPGDNYIGIDGADGLEVAPKWRKLI